MQREIKILSRLKHENIVKLKEAIETTRHVNIVTDFIPGHTLHQYLKTKPGRRLPEEEAKRLFRQIVGALAYCHERNVAHRDVKLENFMLDERKNIKVIDFGFACCS